MIELSTIGSIVFLLGNVFRLYIVHCFMSIFCNNDKYVLIRRVIYVVFFCINSIGSLHIGWLPIVNVVSNVLGIGAIAITYRGKVKNKIFFAFSIVALNIACEDVAFYIIVKADITWTIVIGILLSNMMTYLLVQVLKRIVDYKKGKHTFIREWGLITCIPIFSIFMSAVVLDNCTSEPIIAIGCVCLAIINLLVFYLFDRLHKLYSMELEVALLDQQNKALGSEMNLIKISHDNVHQLNHDISNHFFAIEQLAEQNHSEDIVSYVRSINDTFNTSYRYVSTGNVLLDGFINMKLEEAETCGADVYTDVMISKSIGIEEKDISILFGNLLDNAIDALKQCNAPKMIRISIKEEPGIVALKIENTFNGKINIVDNHFITTKTNGHMHGIGLTNVKHVIEEYKGCLHVNCDNNIFSFNAVLFTNI